MNKTVVAENEERMYVDHVMSVFFGNRVTGLFSGDESCDRQEENTATTSKNHTRTDQQNKKTKLQAVSEEGNLKGEELIQSLRDVEAQTEDVGIVYGNQEKDTGTIPKIRTPTTCKESKEIQVVSGEGSPKSVDFAPYTKNQASNKSHCTVVGTGDMAHAIASQFKHSNMTAGCTMIVTSPKVKTTSSFHDTNVLMVPMMEALNKGADIVILAIPGSSLKEFLLEHYHDVIGNGAIVVDVANSGKEGESVSSIQESLNLKLPWVKGFMDNGAWDMLSRSAVSKFKPTTTMCSNSPAALLKVKAFAEEALGFIVKPLPLKAYVSEMITHQNSLDNHWLHATYIMLFIFVLSELYAIVRYNVCKGYDWSHLPLQVTNKGICAAAISGLALAQLPGTLAHLLNSFSPSRKLPSSLVWLLSIRKHIGLISLWFLVVHIIMSLLLFNPKYYGKFFVNSSSASKLNSMGENSLLFGILGFALYVVVGIASLPSVGQSMVKRQWDFVFGPLVWCALVFGTVHVLIMGVKGWTKLEKWPGGLPPITMTSTLFPMLVILCKLVQVLATTLLKFGWVMRKKNRTIHDRTMHRSPTSESDSDSYEDM